MPAPAEHLGQDPAFLLSRVFACLGVLLEQHLLERVAVGVCVLDLELVQSSLNVILELADPDVDHLWQVVREPARVALANVEQIEQAHQVGPRSERERPGVAPFGCRPERRRYDEPERVRHALEQTRLRKDDRVLVASCLRLFGLGIASELLRLLTLADGLVLVAGQLDFARFLDSAVVNAGHRSLRRKPRVAGVRRCLSTRSPQARRTTPVFFMTARSSKIRVSQRQRRRKQRAEAAARRTRSLPRRQLARRGLPLGIALPLPLYICVVVDMLDWRDRLGLDGCDAELHHESLPAGHATHLLSRLRIDGRQGITPGRDGRRRRARSG